MGGFLRRARESVKDGFTVLRLSRHIKGIIAMPTYYPELERKTDGEMWKDNFKWLCRYKELNHFYTSYGLDVKGFRDADDYIANKPFRAERNQGNRSAYDKEYGGYDYLALLRDKYVFASHVSATLGERFIPKTIGLMVRGRVYLQDEKTWLSVPDFLQTERQAVMKNLDGVFGDDVFLAKIGGGLATVSSQSYDADRFLATFSDKRFLLQALVVQHSALRAFGSSSVNTIRIITVCGKSGAVEVFAAFLRVGVDADSFVDNRAKGGLAVGIDLETGKLMKYGFPHAKFGTKLEQHPLSGITFDGYQLPHWTEVKELVCNAHRQFYGFQSIGWDVAITEDGPVFIEGNDNWEIGGPQDTCGGLMARWNLLREC